MWIFGLCVALLISAALLILLMPMMGRRQSRLIHLLDESLAAGIIDNEQHAARLAQLKTDQPEPAKLALSFRILLVIAIPAAALLLYFQVGSPQALDPQQRIPASGGAQGVQQLQQSLQNNPDNLEGWLTLAGTLVQQQRFSEAVPAYQQALRLIPEDRPERAVVMADIAEAMIFSSGSQQIPNEARTYLQQAISIDPQLQRGLWLLGVIAFQDEDYALAVERWQRLEPLLESDSVRQSVQQQIAQAQARLTGAPDPAPISPIQPTSDISIAVNVSLAPELSAQLAQQAGPPILFVFARVAGSQQPPVAIKRLPLASMPLTVNLTEADAMLPGNTLATLPADSSVQITARVSFSGNAIGQPGDWEGQVTTTVGADSAALPLVIDRVVGQ